MFKCFLEKESKKNKVYIMITWTSTETKTTGGNSAVLNKATNAFAQLHEHTKKKKLE